MNDWQIQELLDERCANNEIIAGWREYHDEIKAHQARIDAVNLFVEECGAVANEHYGRMAARDLVSGSYDVVRGDVVRGRYGADLPLALIDEAERRGLLAGIVAEHYRRTFQNAI